MKSPPVSILLSLLALLAGCAGPNAIRTGEADITAGRYEEGLHAIEAAASAPDAPQEARAAFLRNRALVIAVLERDARAALAAGRMEEADKLYRRLGHFDAAAAERGLADIKQRREQDVLARKAENALKAGDTTGARKLVEQILTRTPRHPAALALAAQLEEKSAPTASSGIPTLGPEFQKHITLEFRDVGVKSVFDAIWHASGINFVLDKDIRSDLKATIMVKDVPVEQAVDAILTTQGLARRTLGPKLLFIYPRTPQKNGEYRDLMIRNFFLAHASAKEVEKLLKTILKAKDVYADDKHNLVVMRDTPERVELAARLIEAQDQAEPEVMLDVEVIEINRNKARDLGITWPQKVEFGVSNPISLRDLRQLNGSSVNVGIGGLPSTTSTTTSASGVLAQLNLAETLGDTKTLANPRIRVRNQEKAKIHIGDRLPVVTTTASSTSTFVGQTVNYIDTGLMLEVQPEVLLDNDVVIKLNLEVSKATQMQLSNGTASGTDIVYDVGTRNTSTVLTIQDGETQVLAGLIKNDESVNNTGVPGLTGVPVLGRLFSSSNTSKADTEILLAITPHVLRNLRRPAPALTEYLSGPESGDGAPGSGPAAGLGAALATPAKPAPAPAPAPARPVSLFNGVGGLNTGSSFSTSGSSSGTSASSSASSDSTSGTTSSQTSTTETTTTTATSSGSTTSPPAAATTLPDFSPPPGVGR